MRKHGIDPEKIRKAAEMLATVAAILAECFVAQDESETLTTREAAELVGLSYETFRKESLFTGAAVRLGGHHPRWRKSVLLRIKKNLEEKAA